MDTHPNAYRAEAAEKRTEIARLASEANALDAKADELEGKTPAVPDMPEPDKSADDSKRKLFNK